VRDDFPGTDASQSASRTNWIIITLVAGIIVLFAVLWFLGGNRNPDQDKLSNPQVEQTAEQDQSKRCSSNATFDLVKRELFRRAAEVRGNNEPGYEQISAAAAVRVENPVLEGEEQASTIDCSGTFYIDLPPGVVAAGNKTNLAADLDYTVSNDAIVLRNADAVISSLASLTRTAVPPPSAGDAGAAAPATIDGNAAAPVAATPQAPSPSASAARPSFDCARAGTPGEQAICQDSGLAKLDADMADQYRRSLATASPAQKQLLQQTRDRFLAYRDGCPSRQCMVQAYFGRMREIRDIMEGRLTPNR
jgi:hypothetical protein